jgi:hypothetical protein
MEQKSVNSSAPIPSQPVAQQLQIWQVIQARPKCRAKRNFAWTSPNGIVSAEVRYNSQGFWIEYYA